MLPAQRADAAKWCREGNLLFAARVDANAPFRRFRFGRGCGSPETSTPSSCRQRIRVMALRSGEALLVSLVLSTVWTSSTYPWNGFGR